jgi:hypothetical protein
VKFIESRKKIELGILSAAFIIALMLAIGLLTDTAFSPGFHGSNYQQASLIDNPDQYWFLIKLQFVVVLSFVFLSIFRFPLIEAGYQKILDFKQANKVIFFMLFFLAIPVLVVAFILLLLTVL